MQNRWVMGVLALGLLIGSPLYSQEAKDNKEKVAEVFTDTEQAGEDFKLQGEYEGEVAGGKLGAQVVAKGEGQFTVAFLTGGLPGAGWDNKTRVQLPAALDRTISSSRLAAPMTGEGWRAMLRDGETITGQTPDGKEFTLKKVIRHSPTEGAKPPADALVLFDGTNTDQLQNAKIVEGTLLKNGTRSKKSFGDCKVHLEFRTPFKPRAGGQSRGNSGVKLQGRYEIQILDSFGLKGDKSDCGAVYTQTPPSINACLPPLSWQTFDIDFKAARYDANGKKTANAVVTVLLNGVQVQDNVEILNKTGSSKAEGPEPAPLEFQDHNNPVVFRNIWVVEPKPEAK